MSMLLRLFKRFDTKLLLSITALVIFGLFVLYSATFDQFVDETASLAFLLKQILAISLGTLLLFGFAYFDYHFLGNYAELIYFFSLALLLIAMNTGQNITGVARWLYIGPLSFQPSELAKISLIFILAKYFTKHKGELATLADIFPALILTFLPFMLVFKQPDLGTAFIFLAIFLGLSYWAGAKPLLLFFILSPLLSIFILHIIPVIPWVLWGIYLLLLLYILHSQKINLFDTAIFWSMNILAGISSPSIWNSLKFYQQQRLLSFLNPALDPLAQGTRYHAAKSVIAIGSGKLTGQGFLQGPLTHLHYIPEHHTDFIFTVIGEEFGLLGTLLILGLFGYILFRGIQIAVNAQDGFGSLLAAGIVTFFAFQIVLNIGMTIGLFPVAGIPLPFLSAGGSSFIISLISIGILESIVIHRKKLFF
ncbi:rod shape-determining protein RodA [Candidatus Margulisiibacteriota bacterium]